MLKPYVLCLFLLMTLLCYPQQNKGKFMIKGGVYYDASQIKTNITESFSPLGKQDANDSNGSISFGYFLTDYIVAGLQGSYDKSIYNQNTTTTISSFRDYSSEISNFLGGFGQYNKFIVKDKFGIIFNLKSGYNWGRWNMEQTLYTSQSGEKTTKNFANTKYFSIDLSPGFIYFIHRKFSLETFLGSVSYANGVAHTGDDIKMKQQSFGTNFSFTSISLGVSYYFGGRKKQE